MPIGITITALWLVFLGYGLALCWAAGVGDGE